MPLTGPEPIVVVGASLAGLRAVEALRRRGVDRSIVWVGAEATLPYDRPPLSKQVLRGTLTPERTALRANYPALGVEPLLGVRAVSLDGRNRQITLSNGDRVPYSAVIIATGARARPLPGTESIAGVHTLRTLEDALAIRAALERRPRVAVVGAGFIGLEVAASCRALGLEVTVVELLATPLERSLGKALGDAVAELHASEGVRLHTGVSVERVLGGEAFGGLSLSDGSIVEAELLVVGVGVVPETAWLDGSGVMLDRGVRCDSRCRTALPDVLACGDVVRWDGPAGPGTLHVEHWTNAVEQANAAVATLLDGDAAPPYVPLPYFWSDQYDAKLQFAGQVGEGDVLRVESGSVLTRDLVATYAHEGRVTAVLTVNNPAVFIRTRRAMQTELQQRAASG